MKGLALVLVGLFALSALLVPLSPSPVSSPSPVPNAHLTTFGGSTTLVLITIHNTQPIATGTYQQMVVVNSSKYAINSNWSNVEFQYFNGTSIYAWVESNATSTATATTVWLKLYSIPGNGYLTVDMVLYPLTDHLLSVSGPTGEAPQLSASYGALDDGARVFTIYHNFSSPTADPLTGWSGQNYVVSGGLSWSVTGGARFYIQSPVNTFAGTNDTIAEERVHTSVWGMDFGTTSASGGMNDWDCVGGGSMAPQPRLFGGWGVQGCYGSGVNTSHGYFILGYLQDRADAYVNDSIYATVAGGNNGLDHWYMSTGGTGTYSGTISYVRLRTIPNDAMPTVTFPSSPTLTVPINIDNTQSTATGTYQQMVVVNSSRYAAYLNANDSNVEWRYPNGTAIYAWMESNNSNASVRTTWWLKLYNIPARSNQTVYMDVYGKTDYLLSEFGPSGEAPQLSASYGALDDGARVFGFYDNFSGTSLRSWWWNSGVATLTINNGLSAISQGAASWTESGLIRTTPVVWPAIIEAYVSDQNGTYRSVGPELTNGTGT
ncbi:MAG: hypothetical protein KGI89_16540, partial [Euryarchaeota archaeon]|nr:hypothetical protein [Euryarchaeota archaeon]